MMLMQNKEDPPITNGKDKCWGRRKCHGSVGRGNNSPAKMEETVHLVLVVSHGIFRECESRNECSESGMDYHTLFGVDWVLII